MYHCVDPDCLSMDEQFLLQALNRLADPYQRYMFTMAADALSIGLLNAVRPVAEKDFPLPIAVDR